MASRQAKSATQGCRWFDTRRGGAVAVIYGTSTGLGHEPTPSWGIRQPRIKGIAEPGDLFGTEVPAGSPG